MFQIIEYLNSFKCSLADSCNTESSNISFLSVLWSKIGKLPAHIAFLNFGMWKIGTKLKLWANSGVEIGTFLLSCLFWLWHIFWGILLSHCNMFTTQRMALWAWFVGILWHFTALWHVANPVTVLICCSLWCLKLSLVLPWIVSPKYSQQQCKWGSFCGTCLI